MSKRLYQRGDVWWCWYFDPRSGKQVRRSTKCRDHRAAEAVLRQYERDAPAEGDVSGPGKAVTVQAALERLIDVGCDGLAPATLAFYCEKGGQVLRLMGDLPAHKLVEDDVFKYVATRTEELTSHCRTCIAKTCTKNHRATIKKELVALRRALDMIKAPTSFFPKFRVKYVPKKRWLTQAEFLGLLALFGPHTKGFLTRPRPGQVDRQLWLALAVFTGGRASEVDNLTWECIDWTARTVHLAGTKTKKAVRTIPLHPSLGLLLSPAKKSSGLIVGRWPHVGRALSRACRHLGYAPCSPNDLRRTLASWLKQHGVDSSVVAQTLGHSSTRMVDQVYGKIDQSTLQRAFALLPGGAPEVPAPAQAAVMDCDKSVIARSPLESRLSPLEVSKLIEKTIGSVLEMRAVRDFAARAPNRKHRTKLVSYVLDERGTTEGDGK